MQLVIALAALAGTLLQMREAMLQLRDHPDLPTFQAIDDWRAEHPRRHPIRRWRQRRELRRIRREHPEEWAVYRRLWLVICSWSLLTVAAGGAVIGAVT